jgi:PPOX class probable F420-dependent enzyme
VFSAWARGVYRHRWLAALAGLGILTALMLPALSLHLGEPGSSAQATSGPAHAALVTLTDGGVPSGVLTPAEVLTSSGGGAPAAVAAEAARAPGVYAAVAPDYQRNGTSIVTVIPAAESSLPSGQATIATLEHTLLSRPHVIGIGGDGASLIDFDHAVYGDFPLMLAIIIISVATFLLLTRAFRSVLLAAKAVVFNLISLAAAYGVLTWVWQDGHGSHALWGIPATGAITMWVPLMVFAFLFGLSMDYEVFILTRIREAYDASGDARHAVTEGLGRTGRLVTSAAAILMLSFLSMSTGPQTDLKILATGLGAGILIDALVVRCLLVPALVALSGSRHQPARRLRSPDRKVRAPRPTSRGPGHGNRSTTAGPGGDPPGPEDLRRDFSHRPRGGIRGKMAASDQNEGQTMDKVLSSERAAEASMFRGKYLSVISYKRDGTSVATPVWFVEEDGRLLVGTDAASGKVKRIRRHPQVRVAVCTGNGRLRGPPVAALAEVLPDSEVRILRRLFARKYRAEIVIFRPLWFLRGALQIGKPQIKPVMLAITPVL